MIKGQQQYLGDFLEVKIDYLGKQRCYAIKKTKKETKSNAHTPNPDTAFVCLFWHLSLNRIVFSYS